MYFHGLGQAFLSRAGTNSACPNPSFSVQNVLCDQTSKFSVHFNDPNDESKKYQGL